MSKLLTLISSFSLNGLVTKPGYLRGKLNRLIEELPFTDDKDLIINELKNAIQDVETAISDLSESGSGEQNFYGDLENKFTSN